MKKVWWEVCELPLHSRWVVLPHRLYVIRIAISCVWTNADTIDAWEWVRVVYSRPPPASHSLLFYLLYLSKFSLSLGYCPIEGESMYLLGESDSREIRQTRQRHISPSWLWLPKLCLCVCLWLGGCFVDHLTFERWQTYHQNEVSEERGADSCQLKWCIGWEGTG